MTASHLSGQNFWGGNSYVHGEGYLPFPERVGSMRARRLRRARRRTTTGWSSPSGSPGSRTAASEWARERRAVAVHSVDAEAGACALDWSIALTNLRERAAALRLAHHRRPRDGRVHRACTGAGPRAFTGARCWPGGGPEQRRGHDGAARRRVPLARLLGEHDDVDGHATLVFAHAPENDRVGARLALVRPLRADRRRRPLLGVLRGVRAAARRHASRYRYRVVVADGAWDAEAIAKQLRRCPGEDRAPVTHRDADR